MAYVHVEGLDELKRALRRIENVDQLDAIRRIFRQGADQVRDEAQLRANVFSFRVSDSITSGASVGRLAAWVKLGKRTVPFAGWADFGSRRPRRGNPRSRGPWSGSGPGPKEGRFVYPAIRSEAPAVSRNIEDRLAVIFYLN